MNSRQEGIVGGQDVGVRIVVRSGERADKGRDSGPLGKEIIDRATLGQKFRNWILTVWICRRTQTWGWVNVPRVILVTIPYGGDSNKSRPSWIRFKCAQNYSDRPGTWFVSEDSRLE